MSQTRPHLVRNLLILTLVALALITAGYFYVKHQQQYPSTDDAYVHANVLYVAPQVSGKVLKVNVKDYQQVTAGDLLVKIDPAPYQAQLAQAKAAYQLATQSNKATDDAILAASSSVTAASAQLEDIQANYRRNMELVAKGVLSKQEGDNIKAQLAQAQSNLEASRAKMSQLINQQGAKGTEAPQVKQAAAALTIATLNLSYTDIIAPHSGHLGKVSIRPGSVVAPGQAMMPLVEANSFWVQANYKETQISYIKPGMSAKITLDMYPDYVFKGQVQAISPASGSSFSLLPPENATGNWVKVPQRFPVSLLFIPDNNANAPVLRAGASANIEIDASQANHQ